MIWDISELLIAFLISVTTSFIVTPIIILLSKKINAVDLPDQVRKFHDGVKPTLGGIALFLGALAGLLYLQPAHPQMLSIIIGAIIIIVVGIIDDLYDMKPMYKLAGQVAAALVVIQSGIIIDKMTIPFIGTVSLGSIGIILSILWIVAVANVMNIIDGLDGLAAGVASIALLSILVIGFMDHRMLVVYLAIVIIGSNIGFLPFNFYPSKIIMGDTGSMFLGYSIAVISILGLFKNVAFFSFLVPLIVIAVPIIDTVLAIIRRKLNNESITTADRKHIHYELMNVGYSHRTSVLILYGFSVYFGILAILFNSGTMLTSLIILAASIIGIRLIMVVAGIRITVNKEEKNKVNIN